MPTPTPRKFVRQDLAAERWDVSTETIRRMIGEGKITGYRLNRRIIRVDLAEVDAAFKVMPTVGRTPQPGTPAPSTLTDLDA